MSTLFFTFIKISTTAQIHQWPRSTPAPITTAACFAVESQKISMSSPRRCRAVLITLLTWAVALAAIRAIAQDAHQNLLRKVIAAAIEQTHHSVHYDGSYVRIPYPGGDVPADTGVCTDVIIRAYRAAGIDLQKEVHEDIGRNFSAYPHQSRWHTAKPDTNIDHRRVPNLMVFFARNGKAFALPTKPEDYLPGDLVAWNLGGGILHIGIVADQKSPDSGRWMIVHNIGAGPQLEDVLFNWKIIGHYRFPVPEVVTE